MEYIIVDFRNDITVSIYDSEELSNYLVDTVLSSDKYSESGTHEIDELQIIHHNMERFDVVAEVINGSGEYTINFYFVRKLDTVKFDFGELTNDY